MDASYRRSLDPQIVDVMLVCTCGRFRGRVFPINPPGVILGRGPFCDVQLDDEGISRRHAEISWLQSELLLVDLHSTNGTFHDEESVDALTLQDGSEFRLGSQTRFQVRIQTKGLQPLNFGSDEVTPADPFALRPPLQPMDEGEVVELLRRELGMCCKSGEGLTALLIGVNPQPGALHRGATSRRVLQVVGRVLRRDDREILVKDDVLLLLFPGVKPERVERILERIATQIAVTRDLMPDLKAEVSFLLSVCGQSTAPDAWLVDMLSCLDAQRQSEGEASAVVRHAC